MSKATLPPAEIQSMILWHEQEIKTLRGQLPKQNLGLVILAFAKKQSRPFNAAQVHKKCCPWANRTGVNQVMLRLATQGLLRRTGAPGGVSFKGGTKASWYTRR